MSPLERLTDANERLDEPHHDTTLLAQSLDQVAAVNRWLGGTRAVLLALMPMLRRAGGGIVLDVGTGSADVPLAIVRAARRARLEVRVVACDVHPQTVRIAKSRTSGVDAIRVVRADALALPFGRDTFDFALLSLTLHHFDDDGQITALRELARVARQKVIVNELHRSRPNYLGARVLAATVWRSNPITRNDGPISVLRAFTPAELMAVAQTAGLKHIRLDRRLFYRLVLMAEAPDGVPA